MCARSTPINQGNGNFLSAAHTVGRIAITAGVRLVDREGLQTYLDDYNQKLIEAFQAKMKEEQAV